MIIAINKESMGGYFDYLSQDLFGEAIGNGDIIGAWNDGTNNIDILDAVLQYFHDIATDYDYDMETIYSFAHWDEKTEKVTNWRDYKYTFHIEYCSEYVDV